MNEFNVGDRWLIKVGNYTHLIDAVITETPSTTVVKVYSRYLDGYVETDGEVEFRLKLGGLPDGMREDHLAPSGYTFWPVNQRPTTNETYGEY